MSGLSSQSSHRAILATKNRERIIRELTHGVQVRNLIDLLICQTFKVVPSCFRGMRPCAIRVRVITFPSHHVLVHEIEILEAELVLNEASNRSEERRVGKECRYQL